MSQPKTSNNPAFRAHKPIPYEIPDFSDVGEKRRHRQGKVGSRFRIFGKIWVQRGSGPGPITVRDPEHDDAFWVNPFGSRSATSEYLTSCWATTPARSSTVSTP
ncbi:MAG: hypothetical protein CM1200mP26_29870 [Acidimicrobiales bacterium]|nr:MAG: hypothetical protein CM1200mP26_29870 [Acidimicrobiales bacterium]